MAKYMNVNPMRLICFFKGHQYNAPVLHPDLLCYCQRCGKEMLNRSVHDIDPIDPDLLEELDRTTSRED
jgi:hypothetical protein